MPDFVVTFEADVSSTTRLLAQLEDRLNPVGLATFLGNMVDPFLRARIDGRFNSEGDDVSGAWHPLTQATEMIRAAKGFSPAHPINVRTNKMRHFLVNTPGELFANGFEVILSHPPLSGNAETEKKIRTAQEGAKSPPTPPRPVLGVNENDLLFITSELVAWITQGYI